jgi:hypothetical protein
MSAAGWSRQDNNQEGLSNMTPRARQYDHEIAATAAPMASAILTGSPTLLSRPANDVADRGRPNLLVRRRRRSLRRDTH